MYSFFLYDIMYKHVLFATTPAPRNPPKGRGDFHSSFPVSNPVHRKTHRPVHQRAKAPAPDRLRHRHCSHCPGGRHRHVVRAGDGGMRIQTEARREAYEESRGTSESRRKEIYRRLREDGPMTADTLMAAMGTTNPNCVRPRLTELAEWGMIRAMGTAKNRYGRSVTLWAAVEQGIKITTPGGNDTESGKTK